MKAKIRIARVSARIGAKTKYGLSQDSGIMNSWNM
jgi:hypothetical protein